MTALYFSGEVQGLRGPGLTGADREQMDEVLEASSSLKNLTSYERVIYAMERGFYDASGNPTTDPGFDLWRRAKFAVTPGQIIRINSTLTGGSILNLYGFYRANGSYFGGPIPGDGATHPYVDLLVTVPADAVAMQVNGFQDTPFLIERQLPPSNDRLDAALDAQKAWKPVGMKVQGYARSYDGVIITSVPGYETIVYQVKGPATFRHASRVQGGGGVVAARVYRDETGAYAGNDLPSTSTPVDYAVDDAAANFTVPGGIGTILVTGYTAGGVPLMLEQLVNSASIGSDARAALDALTGPTPLNLSVAPGFYNLASQMVDTSVAGWNTAFAPVSPGQQYRVQLMNGGAGTAAVVYLNSSGAYVDKVGQGPDPDAPFDQVVTIPAGVAGMQVTGKAYEPILVTKIELQRDIPARLLAAERGVAPLSYWQGKDILWLGTSIPESGYPIIVGEELGAAVVNSALGSSSARFGVAAKRSASDPYGLAGLDWNAVARCLAKTAAECEWLISNWATVGPTLVNSPPATLNAANQAIIRGSTWEARLSPYVGPGLDLIAWDHGRNDWSQNPTGTDAGALTGGSGDMAYLPSSLGTHPDPVTGVGAGADPTRDRGTFLGAMNYLRDKAQAANNYQRHVVIGHYERDRMGNIAAGQEKLAALWGSPIIRTWELAGVSQQTIRNADGTVVMRDGSPLTQSRVLMADDLHPFQQRFFDSLVSIYAVQLRTVR